MPSTYTHSPKNRSVNAHSCAHGSRRRFFVLIAVSRLEIEHPALGVDRGDHRALLDAAVAAPGGQHAAVVLRRKSRAASRSTPGFNSSPEERVKRAAKIAGLADCFSDSFVEREAMWQMRRRRNKLSCTFTVQPASRPSGVVQRVPQAPMTPPTISRTRTRRLEQKRTLAGAFRGLVRCRSKRDKPCADCGRRLSARSHAVGPPARTDQDRRTGPT